MASEDYFSWRTETENHFQALATTQQLKGLLQDYIQSLGFDYFAFFIQHRVPFTRPRVYLHDTYPKLWIKRYKEQNYYAIDPVLQLCLRSGKGVEWTPELFSSAKEMWQDACNFGLLSGFSCSAMASNRAVGILSIGSKRPFITGSRRVELEVKLHFLAEQSLSLLERLNDEALMVQGNDFSQRELEILRWTAEGKTSQEISLILSISEHTVNFYQKNMKKRFNVSNKTQIACYAAAIGLI